MFIITSKKISLNNIKIKRKLENKIRFLNNK